MTNAAKPARTYDARHDTCHDFWQDFWHDFWHDFWLDTCHDTCHDFWRDAPTKDSIFTGYRVSRSEPIS